MDIQPVLTHREQWVVGAICALIAAMMVSALIYLMFS